MKKLETVLMDVADGICTITMNRPNSLNAMNRQLIDDVTAAFDYANQDHQTRVIIFTGSGRAFCAGDDRNEHVHPQNQVEAREFVMAIQAATEAIVFGEKLVVGAINGWAVGGGFEWAINCDFPIWSKNARAFFPEVSLNLFVTGGVTALLPALVGLNKAREMLFLGQKYDAQSLLEMGVAWKISEADQLLDIAKETALKLVDLPPLSSRAMKRTLTSSATQNIKDAMQLETECTIAGFMDPETTKRLKDF